MRSKKEKFTYLDHASATPMDDRVLSEMTPYWSDVFYNPGSVHEGGVKARAVLDEYRERIAKVLGIKPSETIFTSGGTEANTLAIVGGIKALSNARGGRPIHAITAAIEHPSVLDAFRALERDGVASVTYIKPDENGIITPEAVSLALRPETEMASIAYANSEIGTIQPLREIRNALNRESERRVILHSDASQAPEYLNVELDALGLDMMTIDAQKVYGPKGVGALALKQGVEIEPVMHGGAQQYGLRPGTEPLPLIAGLVKAMEIATENREAESERVRALRDYLIERVLELVPGSELNGDSVRRMPNNANFYLPDVDGEYAAIRLSASGFAVGTRSACMQSEDVTKGGSYVLRALGKSEEVPESSLRISLGRQTSSKDIDALIEAIVKVAKH